MPALTIVDVVDVCIALACDCVERGNDHQANQIMRLGFAKIAQYVSLWQMSGDLKAILFLRPMERRLIHLYGPTIGGSLWLDFVDSFWLQSWTDVPLDHDRLTRNIEPTAEWHRQILIKHQSYHRIALMNFSTAALSKN